MAVGDVGGADGDQKGARALQAQRHIAADAVRRVITHLGSPGPGSLGCARDAGRRVFRECCAARTVACEGYEANRIQGVARRSSSTLAKIKWRFSGDGNAR